MYSVPTVCQKLRNWRETGVIRHAPTSNTHSHVSMTDTEKMATRCPRFIKFKRPWMYKVKST